MVLSRFSRSVRQSVVARPSTPPGLRIYAVGDVHGRLDLLNQLSAKIATDVASGNAERVVTIFLGDLVDRGPDSSGVVERLASADFPTPIVALRGNHEEWLLSFLKDSAVLEIWRKFGGLETLHSYGVNISRAFRGAGYEEAREEFVSKLPPAHQKFLDNMRACDERGGYFFCHAGVRPLVALDLQRADDLYWIRDDFLRFEGDFGKFIVHGHTPVAVPEIRSNRINIDTGAFATSILTAIVLEGEDRRFLSTR